MKKRSFSKVSWRKRVCATTMSVVMVTAFAPGVGPAIAQAEESQVPASAEQTSQQAVDLSEYYLTTGETTWYFTDEAVEPMVTVYTYDENDKRIIIDPENYTVTYQKYGELENGGWGFTDVAAADLKTEGQYQVTVTGKADKGYTGTLSAGFWLQDARNLSSYWVSTRYVYVYADKAIEPKITVQRWDSQQQKSITVDPANYTVTYEKATSTDEWGNNVYTDIDKSQLVEVGDYRVVAKAEENSGYTGTVYGEFRIVSPKNLDYGNITLKNWRYYYTGNKLDLGLSVIDAAGQKVSSENYVLDYKKYDQEGETWTDVSEDDLTTTGQYLVTATGVEANGYSGSISREFRVVDARDLGNDNLSVSSSWYVYQGNAIVPKVEVYYWANEDDEQATVINSANYTLTYERETGKDENGDATYTTVDTDDLTVPGNYRVTANANAGSGYTGSVSGTFKIVDSKDLTHGYTSAGYRYFYSGKAISPKVTVTDAAGTVVDATDYTLVFEKESGADEEGEATYTEVSASDIKDAGNYRVKATATGSDGYSGSTSYSTFTVAKSENLDYAKVRLAEDSFDYTGNAVKPKVTVTDLIGEKVDGENYELSYERWDEKKDAYVSVSEGDLIAIGEYRVRVTAKDGTGYTGSRAARFSIVDRKNLNHAIIRVNDYIQSDSGEAVSPRVRVYYYDQNDDRVTIGSANYELSYEKYDEDTGRYSSISSKDLVEPGRYRVTATAKDGSGYTGSTATVFEIFKSTDLDRATLYTRDSYIADGKAVTPKVALKDVRGEKVDSKNYELSYKKYDEKTDEYVSVAAKDLVSAGHYQVIATGKGEYTGSTSCEFHIVDAKDLDNGYMEFDEYIFTKTDKAITPDLTVYSYRGGIVSSTNYDLSYERYDEDADEWVSVNASEVVDTGRYRVTATAKDGSGYSGSTYDTFRIVEDISKNDYASFESMSLSSSSYAYTGSAIEIKPDVTVYAYNSDDQLTAIDSDAYTLSYERLVGWEYEGGFYDEDGIYEKINASSLVDVGTYRVTATAKNGSGYYGSESEIFRISKSANDIGLDHINLDAYNYEYSGQSIALEPSVYGEDGKAIDSSSYTLIYYKYDSDEDDYTVVAKSDIREVGDYRVKAIAKEDSGYTGSAETWFSVDDAVDDSFEDRYRLSVDYYQAYTGETIDIEPKIKVYERESGKTVDSSKYMLSYLFSDHDEDVWESVSSSNVIATGNYRVIATAVGDSEYTGSIYSDFEVVEPEDLDAATVSISSSKYHVGEAAFSYTGKPVTISPTVIGIDGKTVDVSNYVLSYWKWDAETGRYARVKEDNLTEAGEYRVTAGAKDESKYSGSVTTYFYIADNKDLGYANVSLDGSTVTVTDFEDNDVDSSKYTLSLEKYDSSKDGYVAVALSDLGNSGEYRLTATANEGSGYTGSVSRYFEFSNATEEDKAAAAAVAKLVDEAAASFAGDYTDEWFAKAESARTAYGKLTDTQKSLLSKETVAKYDEMVAAADDYAQHQQEQGGEGQQTGGGSTTGGGTTGGGTGGTAGGSTGGTTGGNTGGGNTGGTTTGGGTTGGSTTGGSTTGGTTTGGEQSGEQQGEGQQSGEQTGGEKQGEEQQQSGEQSGEGQQSGEQQGEEHQAGEQTGEQQGSDQGQAGQEQSGGEQQSGEGQQQGDQQQAGDNTPSVGDTATAKASSVTATVEVTSGSAVTVTEATAKSGSSVTVNTVKVDGETYKVTEIAAKAFKGTEAKSIVVGSNVTSIGASAFSGSSTLTSLTIGKNVQSVGKNVLKGSKKVRTIVVKSKKLTRRSIRNMLKGSSVTTIKVKVGSKAQNKNWVKKYRKIFTKAVTGKKVTVK